MQGYVRCFSSFDSHSSLLCQHQARACLSRSPFVPHMSPFSLTSGDLNVPRGAVSWIALLSDLASPFREDVELPTVRDEDLVLWSHEDEDDMERPDCCAVCGINHALDWWPGPIGPRSL